MAMLAEPRRKKRYNLVPKGKPLFEDGDRFGTKMLEKMGWSKGKGLGSREDGQQDFIRIHYKNDVDGLGFVDRDDQWTEHEKHFTGLLDRLNNENSSTNASDECTVAAPTVGFGFNSKTAGKEKHTDQFSGQSLEEKSKNSKARVHYKKFTKGKDMAQYSEKDLANIFGKKASPDDENIYSQFQAFNAGDDKEEIVPLESGKNIVNTGVSVTDYFKMKMEAKQAVPLANGVDNVEDEVPAKKKKNKKKSAEENPGSDENQAKELDTQIINTGVSVNDYFKAKMEALKKKKVLSVQNDIENNVDAGEDMMAIESPTEEAPMKKKKKSKKHPEDDLAEKSPSVVEEAEVSSKKKKKIKNSVVIQDEPESSTAEALSVESFENETTSKKKKTKKRSAEEIAPTDDTNIPKKMKMAPPADIAEIPKKRKNKQSDSEVKNSQPEEESFTRKTTNLLEEQNGNLPLEPSVDEITSKKKKNKKRPVEEDESESLTSSSAVEKPKALPETTAVPKKKKNKQENSAQPPSKKKTNKIQLNATTPIERNSAT